MITIFAVYDMNVDTIVTEEICCYQLCFVEDNTFNENKIPDYITVAIVNYTSEDDVYFWNVTGVLFIHSEENNENELYKMKWEDYSDKTPKKFNVTYREKGFYPITKKFLISVNDIYEPIIDGTTVKWEKI